MKASFGCFILSPRNDEEPLHILEQGLNLDQIPDELEDSRASSSSGDQESDCGTEKLTRAQRKRIRRKKLPHSRQDIIGPLLPTEGSDGKGVNVSTTQEEPPAGNSAAIIVLVQVHCPDDAESCSKQNRLKQRRIDKRLVAGSSVGVATSLESPDRFAKG
ncbi:hypothetical protein RND71_011647 [Anisodus tanguticus]|uniref:Uncharacterized protein n=1 Tax=Anisodus tanguticus TaxID=243964 RepID=A0AAE1VQ05_9SOLA|nr:hypothetical protein RND71_011647 [Anisodus tanguticus]